MGFIQRALYTVGCSLVAVIALAQSPDAAASGTTTNLFVMFGSDFDRPGLIPEAHYNVGLGHTFGLLKKNPFGDELTIGYTYENSGTHGFLHTGFGEHTESLGIMKNFALPKTKRLTGYTWIQTGLTSYTGNLRVQNRLDTAYRWAESFILATITRFGFRRVTTKL